MRDTIYLLFILFLLSSCGGSKKAAESASPFQRKPIVEVTEAELKEDAAEIDGVTKLMLGQDEEALAQFRQVLKLNPAYSSAYYEIGRMYLAKGWTDSALYYTKQAVQCDKSNVWYKKQLAKVYERQRDAKNYTATWEEIVKQSPDVPEYYYDLSNAYLTAGNVAASIEVLDRVEKRYGVSEPISLQKQKLWTYLEKPDKARKEIERLSDAMPTEPRYNAILAESYMAEKNYSKALMYYNRILSSAPDDENIHISLASCYLSMNDMSSAYRHVRQAVQNPSLDCQHRLRYLTEFMQHKEFFTAYGRACFLLADTLAATCGDDKGHQLLYGQMLAAQERFPEAVAALTDYLAVDSSSYKAWEALLICERRVGTDAERLRGHAERAAALFPLQIFPYYILAESFFDEGNCEQARLYMERCLMIAPHDSEVSRLNQSIRETCRGIEN